MLHNGNSSTCFLLPSRPPALWLYETMNEQLQLYTACFEYPSKRLQHLLAITCWCHAKLRITCVFPCHWLLGLLLLIGELGIFNVRKQSQCLLNTQRGDMCRQVCTSVDPELKNKSFTTSRLGVKPAAAVFTGSSAQSANRWATAPMWAVTYLTGTELILSTWNVVVILLLLL